MKRNEPYKINKETFYSEHPDPNKVYKIDYYTKEPGMRCRRNNSMSETTVEVPIKELETIGYKFKKPALITNMEYGIESVIITYRELDDPVHQPI